MMTKPTAHWTAQNARRCFALLIPLVGSSLMAADLASLVNPFVGTKTSSLRDHGNTLPGAVRPFGMLDWGPDMVDEAFYRWETPVTRGFSLTHMSGPGCAQFGEAPVFPMLGLPQGPPAVRGPENRYKAGFRHEDEMAEPGFYAVTLDSGIRVRLAAQVRSGIAEFQFPEGPDEPHTLLFGLGRNLSPRIYASDIQFKKGRLTGSVTSGDNCGDGKNRYRIYFAFEADQSPQAAVVFDEQKAEAGQPADADSRPGGYMSFPTSVKTVRLKAGLSFVSVANAEANLKSEIPGWDLELVRREARAAWNDALGHVLAKGGSERDRKVLYTALYHALLHPSVFSDVDGEYIGFDDRVHKAGKHTQYAGFSGWDIYRSEVQLLAMLFPNIASDMAQSLVADAEQGGGLPVLPVANDDTHAMGGDPSDGILASIYAFGARDFDAAAALRAMVRGGDDPQTRVRLKYVQRPYLEEYLRQGYVCDRKEIWGAASVTLEYQNADFAISRMAAALGDVENEKKFLNRSARWRTLFDPQSRYIRPRGLNGEFLPNFSPEKEDGFMEGNAAQYTWMVPYDLKGVIEAVGGGEAAKARLDDYFSQYYFFDLKNGPYFAIANEPSFGNPWIYNWSGQPWRTQEVVRKTLRDLFTPEPEGLPGNDDLGATSSWAVLAQLGLYPEIPGVGGLTLNSPMFPEVILRLGDHQLQITAKDAPSKLHVRKVTLDGKPVRNWWVGWEQLSRASKLDFTLTAEPNHDPGEAPPSFAPAAP